MSLQSSMTFWRRRPALRRVVLLALAPLLFSTAIFAQTNDLPALEYQVKAAFVLKFPPFVEWPAITAAKEPLKIGILGQDPFGNYFDEAAKTLQASGHPAEIQRAQDLPPLSGCQVIYISASESARTDELLRQLDGKPVLTISDQPGFATRGGIIGFIKDGGKVRFEINAGAARKAGLKISAKLLQIGKLVTSQTLGSQP